MLWPRRDLRSGLHASARAASPLHTQVLLSWLLPCSGVATTALGAVVRTGASRCLLAHGVSGRHMFCPRSLQAPGGEYVRTSIC